jgi:hypothetical protein
MRHAASTELREMLELFRKRIALMQGEGRLRDGPGSPDHQHWRFERLRLAIEGIYAARRRA